MKKYTHILGSANHQRLAPAGASSGARHPPLPAGTTKRTTPQSARRPPPMSTRKTPSTAATLASDGGIGNLTHEQRAEIREIFDSIDVNGRGFISVSQLPDIMRTLGHNVDNIDTMEEWREQIDPNGTGKITYDALENFVALLFDNMEQQDQLMNAFRLFKPDATSLEDARITLDDLQKVSVHLGESIPVDELREMINIADVSGSGGVDFNDFMRVMRKTGLF
ncbi:Centrin-1 [Coemansia sp. RSA 2399]|nr:Centrin-1 [Coemansia sp. RSA 2399]KAJ1905830.1 Centrin-1 [Coemansia sp. IMI 209127]